MSQAEPAVTPFGWASVRAGVTIALYTVVFLVVLPGFLWALGGRLDILFQWPLLGGPWRWVGSVFLMVGALGAAWSMVVLSVRGRGLPISHLAPRRFVREGPYRSVRHPIYLTCVLAFAGAGLLDGSIGRAVCASSFLFVGSMIYSLGFEEPRLEKRLGESYHAYRVSVPLLPFPWIVRTLRRLAASAWTGAIPVIERAANRVVLFRLGPTVWATYGVLLALGAAAAAALIGGLLLAGGLSRAMTFYYLASLALAAVVVGRLAWLAYQWMELIRAPWRVLRTIGFVSWGTIAAALVLPFIFARFVPYSALWLLDRTLPGLLVAAAIGRLGCLTYGCCYGRPSVYGIRWTNQDAKLIRQRPASAGERRIPTQLIASAWALFALALVLAATAAPIVDGVVAGVTLVLYAIGRFGGDCLRDETRFGTWGLTAGQIGSTAAGSIGLGLLFTVTGPPAWGVPAWRIDLVSVIALWPAIALSFVIVFLGCGLHWRRVGRW